MKPTIIHNQAKNGIEIKFSARPADEVLAWLKENKFRWSKFAQVWYAPYTAQLMASVQQLFEVEALAGDWSKQATAERPSPATREPRIELPFLQHLAAYTTVQQLTWGDDLRGGRYNSSCTTFLDADGNVLVKQTYKSRQSYNSYEADEVQTSWRKIGKTGSVSDFTPGELKYGRTEVYRFGKLYGVPVKGKEGWFKPADKNGIAKYLSNGKQVQANKVAYEAAGFTVWTGYHAVMFQPTSMSPAAELVTAKGEDSFTPLTLPSRVAVPAQWRRAYYAIDQKPPERWNERIKLRSDLVFNELMLGKMEVAEFKHFDGMQDMDVYNDRLNWHVPINADIYIGWRDKPHHSGANQLTWGNYYLRYRTMKPLGRYVDLAKLDVASAETKAAAAPVVDVAKLAAQFAKLAESYQAEADRKYSELSSARRNTPKQNKEANSKAVDADIASDQAMYFKAIGEAIAAGTLPYSLRLITPVRKANDLYILIAGLERSAGYYDAYRAGYPRFQEEFKLRGKRELPSYMVKLANGLGWNSYDEVEAAYNDLCSLVGGVMSTDPDKAKLAQLIDKWRFTNQKGFFPTPAALGDRVAYEADIQPRMHVLEPEAGLGDLAEAILRQQPAAQLDVAETMNSLREILTLKGFNVVASDVLTYKGAVYDRIVMNPPFENSQDIDHVRHCFNELLIPGGRLVAIMGEGAFYRSDKKATDFRAWLDEYGHSEQLPEDAFKSAFRPTGVRTRMVVLDKLGKAVVRAPLTTQIVAQSSELANVLHRYVAAGNFESFYETVEDVLEAEQGTQLRAALITLGFRAAELDNVKFLDGKMKVAYEVVFKELAIRLRDKPVPPKPSTNTPDPKLALRAKALLLVLRFRQRQA